MKIAALFSPFNLKMDQNNKVTDMAQENIIYFCDGLNKLV